MILMRGSILDENVKKGGGGGAVFTLLPPSLPLSLLDLKRRRRNKLD